MSNIYYTRNTISFILYNSVTFMIGEPFRLIKPWPDIYLDFCPLMYIMDPAYSLYGCKVIASPALTLHHNVNSLHS